MIRPLAEQVTLVLGGGEGIGRAIALAFAARGARVMVMGEIERTVAEVVGEIAAGGGKARHSVGRVAVARDVCAAAQKTREIFGVLDILVAAGESAALDAATEHLGEGGMLVVVGGAVDPARHPKIACVGIDPGGEDDAAIAQRVLALCATLHA